MAFGSAGTHLAHALQYPIGALTKTPHGLGTGMLLPYVMQACRRAVTSELLQVAEVWGIGGETTDERTQGVVDRIAEITARIGLPATLADIGVARAQLDEVARLAAGVTRLVDNSPIPADEGVLRAILNAAHSGDRAALGGDQQ
jgi:Alcohol dehydrogenase, class IV